MKHTASRTEVNTTFVFTAKDIAAAIITDLKENGHRVIHSGWNESKSQFEVTTVKPEDK